MTTLKTLSAAIILSAAYNQMTEPFYAAPQTQGERNIENFGFSGRDPSRVGGEDPSLRPSGS
jgi:hypothetical protein